MTFLVSKGHTGVVCPWLEKIWIRSHEAVHLVPARKIVKSLYSNDGCLSWWEERAVGEKYQLLGFTSKKNNERLCGTFSIVIDRLLCPF